MHATFLTYPIVLELIIAVWTLIQRTDHAVLFIRFFLRLLLLPLSHVHYSLKRFFCNHCLSVLLPSDNGGSSIRVIIQNRIATFLLHLTSLDRRQEETISKLNSDMISTERRLALIGPLFIASCQQLLISQSVIKSNFFYFNLTCRTTNPSRGLERQLPASTSLRPFHKSSSYNRKCFNTVYLLCPYHCIRFQIR